MTGYLGLSAKTLSAHKKRTRLSTFSIILSVALVVGIFSMLDVLLKFEKLQVINDYGNYHMYITDATDAEIGAVSGRADVKNTGTWIAFNSGSIAGISCDIVALDENFALNMGIRLLEGTYPEAGDELMLESWAADKLGVSAGSRIFFSFPGQEERSFRVSGVFSDFSSTKATGEPVVIPSMQAAGSAQAEKKLLLIEFKEKANMRRAIEEIRENLKLSDERVGLNDRLLAVLGQSDYKAALELYRVGAVLFLIVLAAGIMMIYNTFNISVMERMRSFGLLRCVGASKAQIKRLVRREGFLLLRWGLPLGILLGMGATLFCSALLKYYNGYLFSEIPLFTLSPVGIAAGAAVGVLTVALASSLPAKKASKVSPVSAVSGAGEIRTKKAGKQGLLTRLLPVETAMGIGSALMKKRTFLLMSLSIAVSIAMFLGFNVLVNFMYSSLKTTKPYTPDITLTAEAGFDSELFSRLRELDGVKYVYGRMFGHVTAAFDADRLTDTYREQAGNIETDENGLLIPTEQSWLISYDANQLKWAKTDLAEGTLSQEKLIAENGIIAVFSNIRKGVTTTTADLKLGDKVYIDTASGREEFTVMAILRSAPFSDSSLNLATFITTEQQFTNLTGDTAYDVIDIQLRNHDQEATVSQIKALAGADTTFLDSRQKNSEINQTFFTMAVFVYGFTAVIALISILNIVNTMQTTVSSKTRYLGVLRAVGMSGRQLGRMVAAEALTYSISGAVFGCVLGAFLQWVLIARLLTAIRITWAFPAVQILFIFLITILVSLFSSAAPLKRIRAMGISETIGSLQ